MRLALLFSLLTLGLAVSTAVHAQEAEGTISGRILLGGEVDRNNRFALLVFPADVPQPVDTLRAMPDLISIGAEFTLSGFSDGEYLVVLASTYRDPPNPEETVQFQIFGDVMPQAPRESTRAAVRVKIVDGLPDREVVFDLGPLTALADFPDTGLRLPAEAGRPLRLPLALAGIGLLGVIAGGALRRRVTRA